MDYKTKAKDSKISHTDSEALFVRDTVAYDESFFTITKVTSETIKTREYLYY